MSDIAGEETELSEEQKYKSRSEVFEQMTVCRRMRNVHHLKREENKVVDIVKTKSEYTRIKFKKHKLQSII